MLCYYHAIIILLSYWYHTAICTVTPVSCGNIPVGFQIQLCVTMYIPQWGFLLLIRFSIATRQTKNTSALFVETLSPDYEGKKDHGPRVFVCQFSNHSWQSHVDTYYTDIIFTMRAGCGCFRLFNAISCHFILHHGLFIVFHLISCYFKLVHATTIQLLCYYHASTMLLSSHTNAIIWVLSCYYQAATKRLSCYFISC